jgi:hypothetical protein
MSNVKHVGRLKSNRAKVAIIYRMLPGDAYSALVVGTANLPDEYHNSLMTVIESQQGQDAFELGDLLGSRYFPDGRGMLAALHLDNRLVKVPTSDVEVTPNTMTTVNLVELNVMIAEQKGKTVEELAKPTSETKDIAKVNEIAEAPVAKEAPQAQRNPNDPLSDEDLARSYRSQADAMFKEAQKLRKQADDLDPPKAKKTAKVSEDASA